MALLPQLGGPSVDTHRRALWSTANRHSITHTHQHFFDPDETLGKGPGSAEGRRGEDWVGSEGPRAKCIHVYMRRPTFVSDKCLKILKAESFKTGISIYKLLNKTIMRQHDENGFSDQHDRVVDQETGEVSTVGKSEKVKAKNAEATARFNRFYPFLCKKLKDAGGGDIVLPTHQMARRMFNSVQAKFTDEQIAGIIDMWGKSDHAKEYPSVTAALSINSINQYVIANRKSPYFQ